MAYVQAVTAFVVIALFATSLAAFRDSVVDQVLTAVHACHVKQNPAVAVSVVKNGTVVFSRGYGMTGAPGNPVVRASSRFNIASLSKAFAATLLLKVMEEDGRYNLSSKVRDIFGDGFRFADTLRTEEATVEDMLSHKMAIPANNRLRFNDNITRANLQERLPYLHSPERFRNVYIYSNLMYGLVTRMTEVIGNARWEDLVTRHLYQPLGMNQSTFVKDTDFDDPDTVQPVETYFGQLRNVSRQLPYHWSELAGSGAVVSTADDMAKWMLFHLSQGQNSAGQSVVASKTMKELYEPRTAMSSSTTGKFTRPDVPVTLSYDVYAMGFRRGYYRGYPMVGHGGSTFGYKSLLALIPSRQLGVFVVMSGTDPSYYLRASLLTYLLDEALGDVEPWLNATTLCTFPAPWYNVSSPKSAPPYNASLPQAYHIDFYVGVYENPGYGTLEIRQWNDGGDEGKEAGAKLTVFYGIATWDLIPLPPASSSSSSSSSPPSPSTQLFYGKGRNITAWVDYSPFVFHPPPAGSDVIVELSVPGFESDAPPVFVRQGHSLTSNATVIDFDIIMLTACIYLAYALFCRRDV